MKKSLLKILTLFFALCMTLSIATACSGGNGDEGGNDAPAHVCEFNNLKFNETAHWEECTCGLTQNIEAHKGGSATVDSKAVCEVCNQEYGEKLTGTHEHNYNQLKFNDLTHWYECDCGDKQTAENHKGGEATCTKKALCSVCAQPYGNLLSHEYDNLKFDTTSHWYECVCGDKQIAENHKEGEATCTKKAICSVCAQPYGNLLSHEYDNLKFDTTSHW